MATSSKVNLNTVISLIACQALAQTVSILVVTLSALVGFHLASDKSLATLPIAVISVGAAITLIPASLVMKRFGRKRGFLLGISIGFTAGLLAALAIWQSNFWLFVFANMLIGCYQGFSQYYRFAAADSVPDQYKSQAISWVLTGGVVAALMGPTLAKLTKDLGAIPFLYAYVSISGLSVLAILILSRLSLKAVVPTGQPSGESSERNMWTIVKQPVFLASIAASGIGYAVMVLVMTATPLAMKMSGHTTDDSATVIQWHVLGMFVPSFFTGNLIHRFGVIRIISTGAFILFVHIMLALSGTDFLHFVSGLVLVGIGWNFMFVGGSALLTQSYRHKEQTKTQATHDFLVFGMASISSFLAGVILNHWGWSTVNMISLPLLIMALITIHRKK